MNHDALDQHHQTDPAGPRRRRTLTVVIGAALATVAVVGGAWALTGNDSPKEPTGTQALAPADQTPTPAPTPTKEGAEQPAPAPTPTTDGPRPPAPAPTRATEPQYPAPTPTRATEPQYPAPTPTAAPAPPRPKGAVVRPGDGMARFTQAGRFVPVAGVTVLEQRSGVDLGSSFAPAARTGVAHLRQGSTQWWAVARRVGGSQVIVVKAATVKVDTLDDFIVWAQGVYGADSGEGLL